MTPSTTLRVLTILTAALGIATLVGGQIVSAPVGLVSTVVLIASTAASARLTSPTATVIRRRCAGLVLGVASIAALLSTHARIESSTGHVLGLLLCTAVATHALVVDTVRDARVNTGISISMVVLAADVPVSLTIALPLVTTWICAVAALVVAAHDAEGGGPGALIAVSDRHDTTAGRTDQPGRAGRAEHRRALSAVAGTVTVTVLAGLAAALVLPHPAGLSAHRGIGASNALAADGGDTLGGLAYLGDNALSLDTRGHLSNAPVAIVSTNRDELWQADVLTTYDGREWTDPDGAITVLPGTASSNGTTTHVPPDNRFPDLSGETTSPDDENAVAWLDHSELVVIAPGTVTSVTLQGNATVTHDAGNRLEVDGLGNDAVYLVRSRATPDIDAGATSTGGADATQAVWRALPTSVPARVRALAKQITAGAPDRATAARDIETYLRAHERYDLDSPVAPVGEDSVDDFLFRTHTGFCVQFASAEVVMLRSLGIPSRLVSGFSGGELAPGGGQRILEDSDAHAWAQVWLPGTGWANSDPTAGSLLATHPAHGLSALVGRTGHALGAHLARKILLAALLFGAALLVVVLTGRRRPEDRRRSGRRDSGPRRQRTNAGLFAAFDRLEHALAATGRGRDDAESIRALAARLDATDDVIGALVTVERASYADRPPDRLEAEAAADTLDRLTATLGRTDR